MLIAPERYQENIQAGSDLLVVGEDSTVRSLLKRLFQGNYTLTFAKSARDVLTAVREQSIDLVLLDVTMTGIDGLDVLRAIRADVSSASLPVILISSLEDNSAAVQGLQQGANDYITKPLDAEVVRMRVSTQIALKHAEDERKQTITQLKFTQQMQENLSRIVSHDLKGPLTNIRLAQFMLRDLLRDNVEARNILDNMDVTLNDMVEMIRVFLNAMDSQQLEAHPEPLYVHDLVVEIIEQYRLAADRKQIHFYMRDCERQIFADPHLLRQVLGNLVSNALKFSPPGSQTSFWTEARDGMVRIFVADEGPGIPPEERGRLFSMFGKLSTRPTGGETSTGLGLWIVKELTELQGGAVGVDQPSEGGSRFWLELPSA